MTDVKAAWHLPPGRTLRCAGAVCLVACASLGCTALAPASYSAPVAEDLRASAHIVAVISTVDATDTTTPRLDVPIGKEHEAAKGAATGAGTGFLSGVLVSTAGGPLGAVLAPIIIPAFTLGGMAGGTAVGWTNAVPAKDAEAANEALRRSRSELSAEIARRIAARLASVAKVAAAPDDTGTPDLRIEVSVDKWGLAGGAGSDPLTGFFVATSYRLVRGSDGTTVDTGSFIEGGPQRTVSNWTRDNAARLSRAVDETLSRAAQAVVDSAFLVHDFRVQASHGPVRGDVCGLKPISPSTIHRFGPYESGLARVESLTPRLVWEAFPREQDVNEDTAKSLAHVSEIRYDLRIWKDESGGPGDLTYERTGLPLLPEEGVVGHAVEMPLAAGRSYLWSVRARFRLDGEERVTRWSYDVEIDRQAIPLGFFGKHGWAGAEDPYRQDLVRRGPCLDDSIPPLHYFGFRTP